MPTEYTVMLAEKSDSENENEIGGAIRSGMIKARASTTKISTAGHEDKATKQHHHNTRPRRPILDITDEDDMEISDTDKPDMEDPQYTKGDEDDDDVEERSGDGFGGSEDDFEDTKPPAKKTTTTNPRKTTSTATPTRTGATAYSSLLQATETILAAEGNYDNLLSDDLAWQRDTLGEATKLKQFKTEVLQHSGLVTFVFMRPGSPFLHIMHSPHTYHTHRHDDDLRGKDIAFVGDRTPLQQNPTPIVLSEKSPWSWVAKPFELEPAQLEAFYSQEENKLRLWSLKPKAKPPPTISLPKLLLLPTVFVGYCVKTARTPFELHQGICYYMAQTDTKITREECKLVLDWCLGASHADRGSNTSWLAYSVEAAIPNNPRFHSWTTNRLNAVLGHMPTQARLPPASQPIVAANSVIATQPAQQPDWATIAHQLKTGIVEGLRSTAEAKLATAEPAITTQLKGKEYEDQQVYMLMGFSHRTSPEDLAPVWAAFQTTKNQDTHRLEIGAGMRKWADKKKIPIVRNMDFSDRLLGFIVKMQFNPPGCAGAAYYSSIDKGLTILTCRPPEGEDIEAIRAREIMEDLTKKTHTLSEMLNTPALTGNIKPAEDYNEFLLNLGTFCALLWTLFGPKCDYYEKCYALYQVMNDTPVFVQRKNFSPLLCRQMTWAVIEDGRRYFSRIMTKRHFDEAEEDDEPIMFPKSLLDDVAQAALYMTPINRPSFPAEWRPEYTGSKKRAGTTVTGGSASNAGMLGNTTPAPTGMIHAVQTPSVISGISQGSTQSTKRQKRAPQITGVRQTDIHPKLKMLTLGHLRNHAYLHLKQVLEHSNMTFADLPTISAYMDNGRNTICYNYVLGQCTSQFCHYKKGHVPVDKITEEFANEMVAKLDTPFNQWGGAQAVAAAAKRAGQQE